MYRIAYALDYQGEDRNRLTTLLRYFVAIPWQIVAGIWGFAAQVVTFIAWFVLLFTGRYPEGMYEFNAKYLRMSSRANAFYYLGTDDWPPFHGDPDDDYPVRIGVAPPKEEYDRIKVLFRLIIGIPVMLLAFVQALIVTVIAIVAWFTILFTGTFPQGMHDAFRSGLAYLTRTTAYFLLITEDWPPFSYDESVEQPQLASGGGGAPLASASEQQTPGA